MPTCARCGFIKFNSWMVYKDHMKNTHEIMVAPERILKPTPSEMKKVIANGEAKMSKFIIFPSEKLPLIQDHGIICNCNPCFQKKLDAIIDSQNQAIKDLQNSMELQEIKWKD